MMPMWKTPRSATVERRLKRRRLDNAEASSKATVRRKDRFCRMPLCGCGAMKLGLEVSHQEHKGMGSDPTGERSKPAKLVLLCRVRHREGRVSIHQGTLRVKALTRAGTRGPCVFLVDVRALTKSVAELALGRPRWVEVGRETALHVFEPFTSEQRSALEVLRGMEL